MTRIAIVGGGLIGLACARRLAREGHAVQVFDAAGGAREASWAAAGMLAPHHEADHDGPLWRLCALGLARWPAFIAEMGVTAAELDFRHAGGWLLRRGTADEPLLAAKEVFCAANGIACRRAGAAELHRAEPSLTGADGGLLIDAAQVDPRRLAILLRRRCDESGVTLRYDERVVAIHADGVATTAGDVVADVVVLASGAWSPALAALSGLALEGEPVKGQMLRFASLSSVPPLASFVHCHHAYLVPRAGAGLVVGSTMVAGTFDRADDPEAIARLAEGARALMPALRDTPIAESWTGLRPRLRGGLPAIGWATVPGGRIAIATGHFRNGVLLAPITAEVIAALVTGRSAPADPAWHPLPA